MNKLVAEAAHSGKLESFYFAQAADGAYFCSPNFVY